KQQEKGQLWIGKYQYQTAVERIRGATFKIAVAHHPISWLNTAEENWMTERLDSSFDMFMHGHDHNPWVRPVGTHVVIAAGACYQGATKGNSYYWIIADLEQRSLEIVMRAYSDKGA